MRRLRSGRSREINTGVMAAPTAAFERWLARIGNRNASGEYYLTDVIALAVERRRRGRDDAARERPKPMGVNSKRDLAMLERLYQREQADALLDAGVTLADPARIDVRGTLRLRARREPSTSVAFSKAQ